MKKALSIVLFLSMLVSLSTFRGSIAGDKADVSVYLPQERIVSINKDAVTEKLMKDGKLNRNASQDEITKALQDYVGSGEVKTVKSKYEKMAEAAANKKIQTGLLNGTFNGKKIGQGSILSNVTKTSYNTPVKKVKVLVLLGDYSDYTHNNIPVPEPTDNQYWTENFDAAHYQKLLFGDGLYTTKEGVKSPTFKEYFKEMSNGNLDIEGDVYGWYSVSKNAAYYGEENDSTHDVNPRQFVIELTNQAVKNKVNLSNYDIEDPYDLDGDGDLDEPDGIVDHLMVIHAGVGQEEGGGELGANAIWSHSWDAGIDFVETEQKGMYIYPYTIEAENGTVGLFCHEFVHDLGIPDDYDTQYTADGDIVEYWSIMGGGSWAGKPAGTMPTAINPYSRILLGLIHGGNWINWGYIDYSKDLKSGETKGAVLDTASMSTGNTQAVLINLPKDANMIKMNTPMTGSKEFWGGIGYEIDNNMVVPVDLTYKTAANLTYNIWYDIEKNWDAGFIQVSEDGKNFKSIKTPYTVDDFKNPDGYQSILNSLPAYTGSSNGWLSENIDLSAYAGNKIWIRFRYATDWGTELNGMFIDDINITADGVSILSEGAENGFGSFTRNGFELCNGTRSGSHYYIAEWRSYIGVDEGLEHLVKADIAYNRGLLLWYKNNLYTDNFVGVHPGHGQLGVVDANQYVYNNYGPAKAYFSTHMPFIQLQNAAFSRDKAPDMNLSVYTWANSNILKAKQASPLFKDSYSYFTPRSFASGLKLPNLGLSIKVAGNAADYSRGAILINKK